MFVISNSLDYSLSQTFTITNLHYLKLSLSQTFTNSNLHYLKLSLCRTIAISNLNYLKLSLCRTIAFLSKLRGPLGVNLSYHDQINLPTTIIAIEIIGRINSKLNVFIRRSIFFLCASSKASSKIY